MKINSAGLEAFYNLTIERSFTRAALKLGLSQPAFSQRIKALEESLETTLVIRERQNISLTSEGEKLLKYCKTNLQIEEELLSDFRSTVKGNELSGQIRIGGFSSIVRSILLPSLANLLRENPKVSIQTYTAELSQIPELLRSSRVDFVLHNRSVEKEGIINEFLGYEENVLVQSRKFPHTEIFLDHDENDVTTSSYFSLKGKKLNIRKRYLDDVYGLLDGVKLGLGKAVLPRHLIDTKELEVVDPKVVLRVPLYLVYYQSSFYTKLQKKVIQDIKGYFSQTFPKK